MLAWIPWIFRFFYALLLARLIVNWIEMSRTLDHPLIRLIERASDPLIAPFRGLFHSRFDFSPVLTFFILSMIVEPLVYKIFGF